ncbi:MAG: TIR domain-containing protein [Pseudomonadota bacterium]
MTDDNAFRRLLGLPPLPNSLLDNLPTPQPENPLAAIARALASPPPPPIRPSMVSRLLADPPPPPPMDVGAILRALGGEANPLSSLGIPQKSGLGGAMTNPFRDYGIPMKSGLGAAMTDNIFARTPPSSPNDFDYIPKAPPVQNALTGYGIPPAPKPYLPPVNRTPAVRNLPAVRRRTFFSFQYADIMRVNQVRKSWMIRPNADDPRSPLWFHDSSIWEKSKETNDAKLKRLILDGLDRTSVTCVLAGEETWSRPWVRFEIAASVQRGNGLLAVYIHSVKCPNNGMAYPGHNPLDFIGLYEKPTGGYYLCEKGMDGQWYQYDKITAPVAWPKYLPKASARNIAQPLSAGTRAYDYSKNGYANLSLWVQGAAVAAGK